MEQINDLGAFDAACHLKTEAAVAHFLARAMSTNDAEFIVYAFEAAARSKGAAKIKGGKQLYRSLAKANATLHETMRKFGFGSTVHLSPMQKKPKQKAAERKPKPRTAAHGIRRRA